MEDPQFISQLKKGEAAAFSRLITDYKDKVYNTVLGLVQQAEDAEDLTQEIFISIFQKIGQFREEAQLSTWIYRISVTSALEALRHKGRKKRASAPSPLAFGEHELPHFHHPGVQLEHKETAAILFQAISRLPDQQKAAFILHKLEGLSYQEIAAVLKVSLSAVESLMVRARKGLQLLLENYYEEYNR